MLPNINLRQSQPEKRSDGLILLTVGRNTRSIRKTSEFEAVIAIDQDGKIVWQREFDFCLMDCRRSNQDTLLVMGTDGRALEMNLDGSIRHQWYCPDRFTDRLDLVQPEWIPLDTPKLHHTICELDNGQLASLSIAHRPLPKPTDEWTHLMADTVIIFDRSGEIEKEICLIELLDVERITYDGKVPYWSAQGWPATQDWSHANCLIQDPVDGGFLISLRHQDAVVKLDSAGELVWILGDPTGWREPWQSKLLQIEGGRPFYHQHDLSFAANGDLLFFDNGTAGAFLPNPKQPIEERESFALAYRIDEATMTATETWRYGGADLPYSHYVSGVCEMPNGNRFIACTGITIDPDGNRVERPPLGVGRIELFEITPQDECLFNACIEDPDAQPDAGWNGFRPEYLDSAFASQLLGENIH